MYKPTPTKKVSGIFKNAAKLLVILILNSFWLSSCRSHVMPCPSFSHLNKPDANQIGNGAKVKFDKNGRIKN
ncbi:hypothetical protein [Catalinimonas niigatensis]|uniref:hypothetical protein n=1 Tax=Catalinimonas niigatensis TaxID=1397264 RepID=UPI00266681F8|nr:hypothetical protein [Catalinimonas niigatensis]WPP51540.1 hypothetical protein PZB72_03960 [Catalinimonas niigatensis]